MKINVISRSSQDYLRETKYDIYKVPRNFNSDLHPLQLQREYKRALNAVKLDKIFAKPFVASLSGHIDSVECLLKHPSSLSTLISGSIDGQVKIWNLMNQKCLKTINAHNGVVTGLCIPKHAKYFFTSGDNTVIKQWRMISFDCMISNSFENEDNFNNEDDINSDSINEPTNSIISKSTVIGIDHHREKPQLITCGSTVDLWDESRSAPLKTYNAAIDSCYKVKFNPIETDIFACTCHDRSVILFDSRKNEHIRRILLQMRSNNIAWNPMEAYNFTVANEDYNLYTFDMRQLNKPLKVHLDHISAVIDLDYSPTGKEIVSGSYDKTIRIFPEISQRSREIYFTKRMQRLTSIVWSMDAKYIICASNETDIRIWKANASEKLGPKNYREVNSFNYQERLKHKFQAHPEIKRIARYRHLPKHVYHGKKEMLDIMNAIRRKEKNKIANSKPGTVSSTSLKEKVVLKEIE